MLTHRTRSTALAATLTATLTLGAAGNLAAATADTTANRAESSVTLKDAKDAKALLDIRKIDATTYNDGEFLAAQITYKSSDYAQDNTELTDFSAWFDIDGDNKPEYRMRGNEPATLYKVKNWKPFGGTKVKNCNEARVTGLSPTLIEFVIPSDCIPGDSQTYRVHVSTFFTGDQPYPEGTDHAPNKAKGWTKPVSIG